ncbi:RNA 2',3'-cyclic phosphodiesterase [Methanoculleus bourgensis]|uniref:Phosphoesterase HXTX domain-containing protein n=1 Tax=Methanoculleus bourgensis TaxID=83986 RepID=A0A0X3BJ57_9EURY|nr:RNA 2',3'-cyclic phosphodiesterase [Methanoculleus bourgensis]CVK31634.1 protein of unknown function [Methanoculleus bourgensis]
MVRTFVAIDLPEEIRERVRKSQAILAQSGGRLALVDPANLHVTLKFLGEVEPGKIGAIIEALRAVRAAPFELTVRCAACNSPRRPRVVWCDITDAGRAPPCPAPSPGRWTTSSSRSGSPGNAAPSAPTQRLHG